MKSGSDLKVALLIEKNKIYQDDLENEYELKEIKIDQVPINLSEFKSIDIINNNSTNRISSWLIIDSTRKSALWHIIGFTGLGLSGAALGAGYCCDNQRAFVSLNVLGSLMMTSSFLVRVNNIFGPIDIANVAQFFSNRFFNPIKKMVTNITNYSSLQEDEKKTIFSEMKTIDIDISDQSSLGEIKRAIKKEILNRTPKKQIALANTISSSLKKIGIFTKSPAHKLILEYALHDSLVIKKINNRS
jgi:hypothetical protein